MLFYDSEENNIKNEKAEDPIENEKLLNLIDKNLDIPLLNLVVGLKRNPKFRETLWRCIIINILLNKDITELLIEVKFNIYSRNEKNLLEQSLILK